MNGIEILNTIAEYEPNYGFITPLVVSIVFLIVGVFAKETDWFSPRMILVPLIIAVASTILLLVWKIPTGEMKYQVTISDDVSLKDFHDKYQIVKQEGKIYTIVEKKK